MGDVIGVAGEDAVVQDRQQRNVRVDDIAGSTRCKEFAGSSRREVVKGHTLHTAQNPGQIRLSGAVPPDLPDDCRAASNGLAGSSGLVEDGSDEAVATIDGDERPRVEDQRQAAESLVPVVRPRA